MRFTMGPYTNLQDTILNDVIQSLKKLQGTNSCVNEGKITGRLLKMLELCTATKSPRNVCQENEPSDCRVRAG